jgi:hypothetical protein
VHKGLYPYSTTKNFPQLVEYADVRDVGKAAKDWPQLNFVIYHSAFPLHRRRVEQRLGAVREDRRVDWVSDLADIPAKYGVKNVYGDLGQIFAQSTGGRAAPLRGDDGIAREGPGSRPRGVGNDAIWTGAPQWQIEALRRLEIPEDMQKKYGYAPLGPADGPTKRMIFGENSARIYKYDIKRRAELTTDRIALAKA